jgi:DNA-binding NarL/FixJ family response regulator
VLPLSQPRLIIADDHALFRQGLRSLLALEGLDVTAEVEQASGLEAALAANPCDILLLDLQMEHRTHAIRDQDRPRHGSGSVTGPETRSLSAMA